MANPLHDPSVIREMSLKLEIASLIWERYLGPGCLDLEVGADSKKLATTWLEAIGFQQVEWFQDEQDSLFLALWYNDEEGKNHSFMLEFLGPDADGVTLWEIAGERSL